MSYDRWKTEDPNDDRCTDRNDCRCSRCYDPELCEHCQILPKTNGALCLSCEILESRRKEPEE